MTSADPPQHPSWLRAYHYGHMSFQLRKGHRYPLPRYAWLRQATLDSGLFYPQNVIAGKPAGDALLLRGHSAEYIAKMTHGTLTATELRALNLPWSARMVARARCIVGATHAAAEAALDGGISFVLGGGTHHAHRDWGSGFCVFNDVACAARDVLAKGRVQRLAVFDCDVHQGDGTATILRNDSAVFTCSIHASANFPFEKATSDLDIALPTGTTDAVYLQTVSDAFDQVLEQRPDAIFYVAGADPFVDDRLGQLAISADGLAARDRLVIGRCRTEHIPVIVTLGGGYTHPLQRTVTLNMQTIEIGVEENYQ